LRVIQKEKWSVSQERLFEAEKPYKTRADFHNEQKSWSEKMEVILRGYQPEDIPAMIEIWNVVVEEANAFPQVDNLTKESAVSFFAAQTLTTVAVLDQEIVGLYILHPNNIGRCGHIANASYAVKKNCRGHKVGERLVQHSLQQAKNFGFRLMQFNAVVSTNVMAIHIYEKIGFQRLGVIPGGFHLGDGSYSDIILYFYDLDKNN
jgi:L-amino acid N-acyltransferase YncA